MNVLQTILTVLAAALVEREAEVRAILTALIARQHVLFVGPPGTGKSFACRAAAAAFSGVRFCERLLTPTIDPDDVFGPIDPVEYRTSGRYIRRLENYCAAAEIVFFDEVFRANDAIKDASLHFMGTERQTVLDGVQVKAPLISMFGATNTWNDSADQQAFFDRWLIRRLVKPVSRAGRERLLWDILPSVSPVATLADLCAAQVAADSLPVSQDARDAMAQIIDELAAAGIRPSDRRLRASISVARASAVIDSHPEVTRYDLESLQDVLWDIPGEQAEKSAEIVGRIANPVGARINSLLAEVDQIVNNAPDAASKLAAIKKLEESERECQKLSVSGNGRASKALQFIATEKIKLQALALGIDPAKAAALFATK
jgi:MoxR-like ATPase